MSGALIQSLVWRGYGIAGAQIGSAYAHYRPAGAGAPIVPANLMGTLAAAFAADAKLSFGAPSAYGKPVRFGAFDPTTALPGDYLVGAAGTLFIASIELDVAPMCVLCNDTFSFYRPAETVAVGEDSTYGGQQRGSDIPLALSWPVSSLLTTKAPTGGPGLPGDIRPPWHALTLPAIPSLPGGLPIRDYDVAYDGSGQKHILSAVELTPLGYRMMAMLASA